MARQPRSRSASPTADNTADTIVDAALALASERDWDRVRLSEIAERAGIGLAELRDHFSGKHAILSAFSARIDRQVLGGIDPELAAEPARDRIFDVVMGRFDALQPYRDAVRSIARAFGRRPAELMAWNPVAVRSMSWMLEGAGIDASGRFGALRAQGLAWAYGRTLRVWLDDDDPGMARTMVALDRRLRDGEDWLRRIDSLCGLAGMAQRATRRRRRERRDDMPDEGPEASPG